MDYDILLKIILFSLFPFICINVGGFLGTFFTIKGNARGFLLHLAAGVIFAVVAVELLPDIVKEYNLFIVSVGFFAGLLLMMTIKYITRRAEIKYKQSAELKKSNQTRLSLLPWGLLIGIAVDIFLDGILLGVGFAAGNKEGLLLCIALCLELLALGLVVSTELKNGNFKTKLTLTTIILLSLSICLGALIGAVILNFISKETMTGILAFGLSALMYLVTEELLVEAHELKDTPLNTAVFFVGFFIFLIIALMN